MSVRATVWAMWCLLPADPIKQPLWRLTLILAAEHVQDCGHGYLNLDKIAAVSGREEGDIIRDLNELSALQIVSFRQGDSVRPTRTIKFGMPDRDDEHSSCPATAGDRK